MNNLIDMAYALHILWGWIKSKIYDLKIKYFLLPMVYLMIILSVVPTVNTIVSKVTYTTSSSYTTVAVISEESKYETILDKYNLTKDEFNVLSAIVLTEAEANSYEDAYAVVNTIYNRTKSKNWIYSVNKRYGEGKGTNLYYQAISPNQFVVYQTGTYKKNLGNVTSIGYKAIIDFLYSENIMHNYLSFRAHTIKVSGSESFSDGGNNYFNTLEDANRI